MRAKFPYKKKKKRVGCGPGSGHGKTATRGNKGQQSRTGSGRRRGFEGGQNPLYRRIPKRGFNHFPKRRFSIVNLDQLSRLGESEVTPEKLLERRIIHKLRDGLKVLGDGKLDKAIKIHANHYSKQAKKKIEAAGGEALVIQ
ncbi:MAG: 50S ribosomal protein L15 [Candidatus Omnitrophica bacterium]|nr:50S ribosomal protein L15 [Candidatus Omnitrophota bacterium]